MATQKPQIRSMFPTPVCVHFLPVAQEVNAELRPLILEKMAANGAPDLRGQGWHSSTDFESWGGAPVQTLALSRAAPLDAGWRKDLFGGVMTLTASAKRLVSRKSSGALYSTEPPAAEDAALVALPYHLWANRGPGSMQVWVAELDG